MVLGAKLRVVICRRFSHLKIRHVPPFLRKNQFVVGINNFFDKATYFVAVGFESVGKDEQEKLQKEDFVEKAVKGVTNWFIKNR